MRDDERGFATSFEFRQNPCVKDLLKERILIGSPFVEHIERAILEISREQRQTLALPLRKRRRGEDAVGNSNFMREMELFEVLSRLVIQVARLETKKAFKKIEVPENGGEILSKIIAVHVGDQTPIQPDLPAFRRVKAGHDFCQRRFSTAVSSDQED